MEILDLETLKRRSTSPGPGTTITPLYSNVHGAAQGLIAVDLWVVEPGSETPVRFHAEEPVLFVISGSGELSGIDGRNPARIGPETVVHIGPYEKHMLRNTGAEPLRLLVSTPLLVRTNRALGIRDDMGEEAPVPQVATGMVRSVREEPRNVHAEAATLTTPELPEPDAPVAPAGRANRPQPPRSRVAPEADVEEEADVPSVVDIASLMKRASDLPPSTGREKRRPAREPEPQPEPPVVEVEQPQDSEEAEEQSSLMELAIVFDGGSRGNPGQGYGSYLVQAPGRKPVIKRVEFGDNYTNNQAEYDSLIASLEYIVERLTATGRTPQGVQLQIKTDSDLVVNQVMGTYKVKDAGLKKRYEKAISLLEQFADWFIEWHPRDESVRLLGH